jgi:CubicO group peptidase (beta-lactamase class C family)
MHIVKNILVLIILTVLPFTTLATEMSYGWLVTNGFRNNANIALVNPSGDSKPLPSKSVPITDEVKQLLDDLFNKNNTKAMIVARDSEIIYERYSFGVGKRNTPLGYSMSKSLTALTVGRAICDGHISNIDDPIKKYVPILSATSWGEASIKDVLRMSSGAYRTDLRLNGHKSRELELSIGPALAEGRMTADFIDLMKVADEKSLPFGSTWNYSNFDTIALGLLVQNATGMPFPKYFEKAIWQNIGAEYRGSWLINRNGQTSTYQGFSASPHDWIRIGVMVLKELENKENCFGKFLKDATSKQISSYGLATSYGYQIWVGCNSATTDFCFIGFGGQFLLFNIATNTVIYHHATTFSPDVRQTPKVMDQLIPALAKSN